MSIWLLWGCGSSCAPHQRSCSCAFLRRLARFHLHVQHHCMKLALVSVPGHFPLFSQGVDLCYCRVISLSKGCSHVVYFGATENLESSACSYTQHLFRSCSALSSPAKMTFSTAHSEADCAGSRCRWRSLAISERPDPGFILYSMYWLRSALGLASHSTMYSGRTQQTFALTSGFTCMSA